MNLGRSIRSLVVVLFAFLTPSLAVAQTGTVSGTVTDSTGAVVPDAVVRIAGTSLRATTGPTGEFQIQNVPPGTHTVTAGVIGFRPEKQDVTLEPGGSATLQFRLLGTPIKIAATEVVVGSRAPHTAADELAVPVDVYDSQTLAKQGTTETSQVLQTVAPSVNFPRQSVTDATDIVRPFTLRGLSPDHTLVLIDGSRRHQTAVVNTFAYGTNAGSSGVDMNAIPSSAIDRIEVLRDGASAQYGSDAIAGVVNVVTKKGRFAPFVNFTSGRYTPDAYPDDGTTVNVNGGWGFKMGKGSLSLFGEFLDREPTNRAWADPYDVSGNGIADSVNAEGQVVLKRNPVPQPNHHWGDGLEKDILSYGALDLPLNDQATSAFFAHGGYSFRRGSGNGYRRYADSERNWPTIYPLGYLPEFHPDVTDFSFAGGIRSQASGWRMDVQGSYGHNDFDYNLRNTLNVSLGPSLGTATAPGTDGIPGNSDDPGIPNQTSFFAGRVSRNEAIVTANASRQADLGLPNLVNVAVGAAYRREAYKITQGERASWIDGGDTTQYGGDAPGGSQVFPGFSPSDEADADRSNIGLYLDLESNLTAKLLANVAGRFENYNDFGSVVTGKAAFRLQPSPQWTLRAAGSTGFRAPGLGQIHFSKVVTNFIGGVAEDIGVFPVDHPAARALGSKDLKEETSVNLSAGFAWSPRSDLTFTADIFRIAIDDRIILGATFDDDSTRAILSRAGYPDIAGVQYFTNGLDTRTKGVDVTANWKHPVGANRAWSVTGSMNYTKNEITRVDPLPAVLQSSEETGLLDEVTRVAIVEERPDWRGTVSTEYTDGAFRALGRASYFGKFASAQPGYCDDCREEYGSKTLFDAEAGYKFASMELTAGARNLFDTYPDKAKDDFNNNFGTFPWAAASPFGYNGRYLYIRSSFALTR